MTACLCQPTSFPFSCQRHNCDKTAHWHRLCQTRDDYFQLWEAGQGPGQMTTGNPARLEPCRYRSLEPQEHVSCELCGARTLLVPIYRCDLLGECSERRWGTRDPRARQMPCCLVCQRYEARPVNASENPESP